MANFRQHTSKQETFFLAGRNSETNELLIKQVEKNEDVLHTKASGSPFVNIKGKTRKGDLKEAAIFCAYYSQDWKKNKKDVIVHVFKGKDIFKDKIMRQGTFGIKKFKEIKVKKEEIEEFNK
ncbi:MAG TPA: NFACT RNA binding domain-containing protein [Candidatus Nanoarchaeia archaeon]|nr:NFACT RNA binding domain-containing protein [Candidatus Nanoarchaeia archaeon]